MRHRIAMLLRRAANRLDPPPYWRNVLTTNTWVGETGKWTATVWEYPNGTVAR